LKAGQPDRLESAPGGKEYFTGDAAVLERGKVVFAETCARCHSSKLPDAAWSKMDPGGCSGPNYLTCWKRYWDYTKSDDFKQKMREIVAAPDFLDGNYLSTDARVPVTLLRTNACSPLATNAIRDNIWDNFSSSTYKDLPSVGTITVQDPFTGERHPFVMPGGGPGYTRVPSLISIWSTAPFLLNNQLGAFEENPSVESRIKSFQVSIEQLLWPEKRRIEPGLDGFIMRTTERSWITIPKQDIPRALSDLPLSWLERLPFLVEQWTSWVFGRTQEGYYKLGPVPKGFPINLAEFRPLADIAEPRERDETQRNFVAFKGKVASSPPPGASASDQEMFAWWANLREPLLKFSKCPDFVVNRGHYFGTAKFNETEGLSDDEKSFGSEPVLSDDDKRALIEFLKTF
jgi:hypothetical protein